MAEDGKSGKRVVGVLLGLVLVVALAAWFGAMRLEKGSHPGDGADSDIASVLSDGVLYEARGGDPGLVIAKDVGSGKEIWRSELGSITSKPNLVVNEEVIEVRIAGTSWMSLNKATGEPLE